MSLRRFLRRAIGRGVLSVYGWTIDGEAPPVPKAVVVSYPHTSNWDFPFALAICWSLDLDIFWLGKDSLFKGPKGWFFQRMGGIAVDRSQHTNLVDAIVATLEPMDRVLVLIPAEGTRKKAERLKTGFYWVAVKAEIPIVLGYLDYTKRTGGFPHVFTPSGDPEADLAILREVYAGVEGRFPEKQTEITFGDPSS